MDSTALLEQARETTTSIQSDTRLAVIAFDKRLLIESLTREIEELTTQIAVNRAKWDQKMAEIPAIAVRHANEAEWCEEFDRAMESVGLPCNRQEQVTVSGTLTCDVEVEVEVDVEDKVRELLDGYSVGEVDGEKEVTVEVSVSTSFETTVEVRAGRCACTSIDTYPDSWQANSWSDEFDSLTDDHTVTNIRVTDLSCDNC